MFLILYLQDTPWALWIRLSTIDSALYCMWIVGITGRNFVFVVLLTESIATAMGYLVSK